MVQKLEKSVDLLVSTDGGGSIDCTGTHMKETEEGELLDVLWAWRTARRVRLRPKSEMNGEKKYVTGEMFGNEKHGKGILYFDKGS